MRKHIILTVAVLSCIGMMACGGGGTSEPTKAPSQEAVTKAPETDNTQGGEKVETPAGDENETPAPEATQVPEATPAPVEEPKADIYSFEIKIDGDTYKFPMWYKEFEAKGWTCVEDMSGDAPALAEGSFDFEKNGIQYSVEMFNSSASAKPMTECAVTGVRSDSFYYPNGEFPDIVLPGDIRVGVATEEDVLNAYGEPTDDYDGGEEYRVLYYEKGNDNYVHLTIEKGILTEIELVNIEIMEDADFNVSYAVPDYFDAYQVPSSDIGDEEHMVFEMNGKFFSLPCPITVLLDNGFSILDTYQRAELASGAQGEVRLRYGNHSVDVNVCNYTSYATGIMNCHVTDITADDTMQKIDISVLGGIKIGTSIADVEKMLAPFNYEKAKGHENTDYSSTTFTVNHPEHPTTYYWIHCSDRADAVDTISVTSTMAPSGGIGAPTDKTADSAVTEVSEDSIYNFRMTLHGDEMNVPMSYANLAAMGWVLDEDEDATAQLAAGDSESSVWWEKDGYNISTEITNTTENALAMSECTVTSVVFSKHHIPYYDRDTYNGEVILPGGIKLYESTRADIEAAYGAPSTGKATDEYYHLWYTYHDGRGVDLWVDNETGVLIYIGINNQ